MPLSSAELARDAAACVAAGAAAIHMHPRDPEGRETLSPDPIDAAVAAVRDACGVAVGVSTGEWIEPDLERRLELIAAWNEPDYASVNLGEEGAERVMEALLRAGVGVEAGLADASDAERLVASGLGERVTRILVEPYASERTLEVVGEIHAALDRLGLEAPRLQHSDGPATWPVLRDALEQGMDTRIGLEDTLVGRVGAAAAGNEELVRLARGIV